jgi:hypothetical protein
MERVPVLVDTFPSLSEIEALQGALRRVGLEAEVEQTVPPQGLAPWLVLIGVPVGQFLAGFFGAAGKDAWEAFEQFFDEIKSSHEPKRRFWQRRKAPRQGELVIRPNIETPAEMEPSERVAVMMGWIDTGDTATSLALPSNLPEEAFPALFEIDLSKYPNHHIFWNPETKKWEGHAKERPASAEE